MVEYVEQENSPSGRSRTDHINVFAEGFVVVCCINGSVGVTFHIIVQGNSLISYQLLEIIPVPLCVSGPGFRKIFNDNWDTGLVKVSFEYFWINTLDSRDFFQLHALQVYPKTAVKIQIVHKIAIRLRLFE